MRVIESPVLKDRILFRRTGRESGGARARRFFVPAIWPREHLHARQEEVLEVIAGEMTATVGRVEKRCGPGERLVIPPGTRHTWRNAGSMELYVRATFRRALRAEPSFETVFGLRRSDAADAPPFLAADGADARVGSLSSRHAPPVALRVLGGFSVKNDR